MRLLIVAVCLTVGSPALGQELLEVSPGHGEAGTSLEIKITADTEIYFTYNTEVFFFPATDITHGLVDPFENTLTTTIEIPADTPAGMQNLLVRIDGILDYSGQDLFEVTRSSDPEIVEVDPDSASAGGSHSLVVTGVNTSFSGTSTVEFSGTGIQVDSVGSRDALTLDVDITIAADASRNARDITVTTGNQVATGPGLFTVTAPPVSLNPSEGTQGDTITRLTVTGGPEGYDSMTGASLGEGIVIGSVEAPTSSSLVLNDVYIAENARVGPRPLILFSPSEVYPDAFLVKQGPNTLLLSVTPDHGDRGHPGLQVALVGQNTHFDDDEVRVSLADPDVREIQQNATGAEHMTAVLILGDDAAEGPVDVTVAVGANSCSNCEKVTLQDGFTITAPGSLDSVDPAMIDAGSSASVSFTATDGQFIQGQTILTIEPPQGVQITSVNVVDSDNLTADIQADADAPGAARNVRAVTGTEVAVGFGLLDIHNPQILGLTPNGAEQGWDLEVTVLGVDIPFDSGTTVTFSGAGITVSSVSFDSAEPDQVKAQIIVAEDAALGRRDVTVNAQGVEVTLLEGFTIRPSLFNGNGNGGCSCGAKRSFSMLVVVGMLGLALVRRRIKIIIPPR
jgi:hypothetical protein